MLRVPPEVTCTEHPFPSTPLFRSARDARRERQPVERGGGDHRHHRDQQQHGEQRGAALGLKRTGHRAGLLAAGGCGVGAVRKSMVSGARPARSEEHTSELQSLMRISYAVSRLKKKKVNTTKM